MQFAVLICNLNIFYRSFQNYKMELLMRSFGLSIFKITLFDDFNKEIFSYIASKASKLTLFFKFTT